MQPTSHPPSVRPGQPRSGTLPAFSQLPAQVQVFLRQVIESQLYDQAALLDILQKMPNLRELNTPEKMAQAMVTAGHLTEFQSQRLMSGNPQGLVLGNYRILSRLGGGTVGTVFVGEHRLLRRKVAIKVLHVDENFPPPVLERFQVEMRLLAGLQHPHIVTAYDAGIVNSNEVGMPTIHFLVMELIEGGDLEQYVYDHGVLSIEQGCEYIRQAAAGLQAAHDAHLIHRDLKPSNLLLTRDGQIKLVDFGLARQFTSNLTERSSLLGSVEFMAPEQSIDPTSVGSHSDIYGLGATLFWLISGQTPFPQSDNMVEVLRWLQTGRPRRLREFIEDVPPELDELMDRMLSRDPQQRPPSALSVMKELARFATPGGNWANEIWTDATNLQAEDTFSTNSQLLVHLPAPAMPATLDNTPLVLVVDNDTNVRKAITALFEKNGCRCLETADAIQALDLLQDEMIDLAFFDLRVMGPNGFEISLQVRERPGRSNLKLMLCTPATNFRDMLRLIPMGADDLLPRPFDLTYLEARANYLLQLKASQDRLTRLTKHLLATNRQLEQSFAARTKDLMRVQDALVLGLAKLAESRDGETVGHITRLQRYSLTLANRLKLDPAWANILDHKFLSDMERAIPLHDIGKVCLPDAILLKPGALDERERSIMEQHPILGAELLESIAKDFGNAFSFLGMARAVVRHHHERYDGYGYPDRLSGEAIPHVARIVGLADVYDALRRERPYKPALQHAQAVRSMLQENAGHFDPKVLQAFAACHEQFQRIYDTTTI